MEGGVAGKSKATLKRTTITGNNPLSSKVKYIPYREPCEPRFLAQTERAAVVEDLGGRGAGGGGGQAGDPWPQAAPRCLLSLF